MEVSLGTFLLGMIIGAIVYSWRIRSKTCGTIKMARSDPYEPPYLFLEVTTSVEDIMSHEVVMFKVSQK